MQFSVLCEEFLDNLAQDLEIMDKQSNLEIEYSDGVLNILIIESGKMYVINRNSGNQKIWFSSPFSGTDYFAFDQQKKQWLSAKDIDLSSKLIAELKDYLT
ncbi:MAG: frataxin family protein [Alphaproteobacteria bacterium]